MRSDSFKTVIDVDGRRVKILRDGHRARVPLMLRDSANPALTPLQRAVLTDQELASCRPGFRFAKDAAVRDAKAEAKAKICAAYDAEIGRQYLMPSGFGEQWRRS